VQVRGLFWILVTSLFFTVRSCYPHAQPPTWKTTPCRLRNGLVTAIVYLDALNFLDRAYRSFGLSSDERGAVYCVIVLITWHWKQTQDIWTCCG
jgi:hypothetical protein